MNDNKKLDILITGAYPPPFGGMSVYVQRLSEYLRRRGHRVDVYERIDDKPLSPLAHVFSFRSKWRFYRAILFAKRYDIVHINESVWRQRAVIMWLAKISGARVVLTLHSFREEITSAKSVSPWIKTVLRNCDYIISSGQAETDKVQRAVHRTERVETLSPFIAPNITIKHKPLPTEIEAFIASHDNIISANASNLDFHHGKDIYGIDLMLRLTERVNVTKRVGTVFCLSKMTNQAYFDNIMKIIKDKELHDHFLFYYGTVEMWRIIKSSSIFIRPTRTDSYGISVAESIYCQTPAIASDVCKRAVGTILFKSEDEDDLYQKTMALLNDEHVVDYSQLEPLDSAPKIERLYYSISKI